MASEGKIEKEEKTEQKKRRRDLIVKVEQLVCTTGEGGRREGGGRTGVVISSECPFHSEIDGFLPFFYPRDGIKRYTTSTIYPYLGHFHEIALFRIDVGHFNKVHL